MTINTGPAQILHNERAQAVNAFPENFSLAAVVGVTPIGAFLRVRLQAGDLSRFASTSLHFRLVLPQPHRTEPVWPGLGADGETQWPTGEDALHRPAYTIRDIDYDAGWIDVDVFVHDGGRVSVWAQSAQQGDVVGLAGPGGPKIPEASDILLAGDETAFPAIARILSSPSRPKTGEVVLFSDARDYDFEQPAGYSLHWMSLSEGREAFIQRLIATPRASDSYIWFAGEKSMAQRLRSHFHDTCGISKDASYISAYWRRAS